MWLQQDANMLFVAGEHKNKTNLTLLPQKNWYWIQRQAALHHYQGNNNIFLISYTGNTCLLCFIILHKHTNRRLCYTQTFPGSGAQHITNLCAPTIYTLPCTITGKLWDLLGRIIWIMSSLKSALSLITQLISILWESDGLDLVVEAVDFFKFEAIFCKGCWNLNSILGFLSNNKCWTSFLFSSGAACF